MIIDNCKFKFLNRLDDNHFSVRSSWNTEKEITILEMSMISNHTIIEKYNTQKSKHEALITARLFGIIFFLSALMITLPQIFIFSNRKISLLCILIWSLVNVVISVIIGIIAKHRMFKKQMKEM